MTRRDSEEEVHTPKDLAVERDYTEAEIAAIWHVHRRPSIACSMAYPAY